jgi:MoxR-like ATPase
MASADPRPYAKRFDPPEVFMGPGGPDALGDRRDGDVYVFTPKIVLAVNVALATSRPLLVSGRPGSGKSTLAASVAAFLDRRYVPEVIKPRTQANELQWSFDALRRLRDAQAEELKDDEAYVRPGVLWRAFKAPAGDPRPAVVLIDEIDKADPDVPNSLLVTLGELTFTVDETGQKVTADAGEPPLIVLTTNDERELPRPFLRRCVVLTLESPGAERLREIARAHGLDGDSDLAKRLAELTVTLRTQAAKDGRPEPSAAEYLDALRACRDLSVTSDSDVWKELVAATLDKQLDPTHVAR